MQDIVVIWGSTRSRTAPLLRDAESAVSQEMDRLYINAYTDDAATGSQAGRTPARSCTTTEQLQTDVADAFLRGCAWVPRLSSAGSAVNGLFRWAGGKGRIAGQTGVRSIDARRSLRQAEPRMSAPRWIEALHRRRCDSAGSAAPRTLGLPTMPSAALRQCRRDVRYTGVTDRFVELWLLDRLRDFAAIETEQRAPVP